MLIQHFFLILEFISGELIQKDASVSVSGSFIRGMPQKIVIALKYTEDNLTITGLSFYNRYKEGMQQKERRSKKKVTDLVVASQSHRAMDPWMVSEAN